MSALNFKNPAWFDEEDINIFREAVYGFYKNEIGATRRKVSKKQNDRPRVLEQGRCDGFAELWDF